MIGRRKTPDGLPFRLYVTKGKFKVRYFYKLPGGKLAFSLTARANNAAEVAAVRKDAIGRAEILNGHAAAPGTVGALITAYFRWQDKMPRDSEDRKAEGTLIENKREKKNLEKVFGLMAPQDIRPKDVYGYLAARAAQGAPAKANKEIALLSAILEYGRRLGQLEVNPCRDIRYNKTRPSTKFVEWSHVEFAIAEARRRGGSYLVCALCVMAAYLTVSRPTEMRMLTRQSESPEGLRIAVGKRKAGQAQKHKLIEWSPELRAVIDEAKTLQRTASIYLFGNAEGQPYTRSGWNTIWTRLMVYCEELAKEEGKTFERFTLANMRPTSITDRLDSNDETTRTGQASGHADGRMVAKVYDRRTVKRSKATPIKG
ncbi:hypothetical protein [Herbaspirillum sp. CAH-3]|uniref:hypothetical protein n=1 Tax=Herbaspirillum sp. CAH-3 TaxID=2605746 RepID=UPI0012AC8296|nr:hypothetical protein [Herbaspirillum sp. CAH-3]MRT30769.1 hypothetical protein [Herbaspirillum sp. CAH-3]